MMPALKTLFLMNNRINKILPIETALPNLKVLNLSNNKVFFLFFDNFIITQLFTRLAQILLIQNFIEINFSHINNFIISILKFIY